MHQARCCKFWLHETYLHDGQDLPPLLQLLRDGGGRPRLARRHKGRLRHALRGRRAACFGTRRQGLSRQRGFWQRRGGSSGDCSGGRSAASRRRRLLVGQQAVSHLRHARQLLRLWGTCNISSSNQH